MASSLLIVKHPNPTKVSLGADFAGEWDEATEKAQKQAYRVAILPTNISEPIAQELLTHLSYQNPEIVVVLVDEDKRAASFQNILSQFEIYRIIDSFSGPELEETAIGAIEKARRIDQTEQLSLIVRQQNKRLNDLKVDLEQRVAKRQKFLEDSKKRLATTNFRVAALHRALVAVHKSSSVNEMESLLTEALQEDLKLTWIRIIFHNQSNLREKLKRSRRLVSLFGATLTKEQEVLGDVYFARPLEQPFSRTEREFLRRIGDTISIAIDRIVKLEELETLQQQWEVTFNAISSPLSIISKDREIIQTNRSFEQQTGLTSEALVGEKCYKALFDLDHPCQGCQLGQSFELGRVQSALSNEFEFSVQSYTIRSSETVFVNLYQDQKQQRALERRILQSTKMVEIGTIGSSIAHELNNPIGGIINYLQLIKMELDQDHESYSDIAEMEAGAQRCKEIVQNLLSFTRKPSIDQTEEVSVNDLIQRAMNIVDLQARSKGVQVSFAKAEDAFVLGQRNLLVQAITNILQNALEAIENKKNEHRNHKGLIEITHSQSGDTHRIRITDNGVGIEQSHIAKVLDPLFTSKNPNLHSGLGLTLSFQIISELGGDIDLQSQHGSGTTVSVSIPLPS